MKIADTHSDTFDDPNTQATTSQPKEPSSFLSSKDRVILMELRFF